MSWQLECEAPRHEAQRREAERQKRYALAHAMRAEGHTHQEIRERTGIPLSTLHGLFRGLGRKQ